MRARTALTEAWFCRNTGLKGADVSCLLFELAASHVFFLGTLPSIKNAEKGISVHRKAHVNICELLDVEAKLEAIPPPVCNRRVTLLSRAAEPFRQPPPSKPKDTPKAAVNVDFALDDNRQFRVKVAPHEKFQLDVKICFRYQVNGVDQPIGKLERQIKVTLSYCFCLGEHVVLDVQKFLKGGLSELQTVSQAASDVAQRAEKVASTVRESKSDTASDSEPEEESTEGTDKAEKDDDEEEKQSDEEEADE